MYRLGIVVTVVLFMLLLPSSTYAEKRYFTSSEGYRCELTVEGTLSKGVCRNPRQFSDYYLVFIEINQDTNRVFLDYLYPTQYDDVMLIRRENMTIARFYATFGQ